jgi:hypothetical protein
MSVEEFMEALTGNMKYSIKIRVMQFTQPSFTNKEEVQLDFFGRHDGSFKTHIEIMGCYLVVLLAHRAASENSAETMVVVPRPYHTRGRQCGLPGPRSDEESECQTIYLVHWGTGDVVFVRSPLLTAFSLLFEFLTSVVAKARSQRYIFPNLSVHI